MSASLHSVPLSGEPIAILAATARDADLARDTLDRAGWQGRIVSDPSTLRAALEAGCGALLLAEEACSRTVLEDLGAFLETQPVWSDLPILFLLPAPRPNSLQSESKDGFERVARWIPRGNISY